MIIVQNTVKTNYPMSATSHGGDVTLHGNAGDVVEVNYHFTGGVTGGASAATITGFKWQFAPKLLPAMDEDTVSQTNARKWFDVLKTDAQWAKYFVDENGNSIEDWPTDPVTLAVSGNYNNVHVNRKIKLPSTFLVRAVMGNPVFTGGTSPTIRHSQHVTQYSQLD